MRDQDEFWECTACAAKPGSPTLCESCLHNRALIDAAKAKADQMIRNAGIRATVTSNLIYALRINAAILHAIANGACRGLISEEAQFKIRDGDIRRVSYTIGEALDLADKTIEDAKVTT